MAAAKNTSLPKSPIAKNPNDFSKNKGDTVPEAQPKDESVPLKNFVWKSCFSQVVGFLLSLFCLLRIALMYEFLLRCPCASTFPGSPFCFKRIYFCKYLYNFSKGSIGKRKRFLHFLAGACSARFGIILIATTVLVQLRGGKPRSHLERKCFSAAPERGYPLLLTNDFFNRLNAKNGGDIVRVSLYIH